MRVAKRKSAQYTALNWVIVNNGWAQCPPFYLPVTVRKEWQRAIANGLLRRLTGLEAHRILLNRRSVRTILLAMTVEAAEDENRSALWEDKDGKPSCETCQDKLVNVVQEIELLNSIDSYMYYTLTEAGLSKLEEFEKEEGG